MENFNPKPEDLNNGKKVYKAGIVDMSKLVETQARDVADSRMTEDKEARAKGFKNWFVKTGKRIWKHNLAQEWYRQREIGRAKKEISESGNLYAGETKDASLKDYEGAKKAIVERFTSEYEEEMLKTEEKESKESITDEKTKKAIKDLIIQFAGNPNMSEDAFKEEQKRILSTSHPEYAKKGGMYADNLLDIAREIKNSITHGEKLNEMDFDVEITLGKAEESLNTEAQHTAFTKIIEKTQNSKIGKYFFNEPTAVLAAAGLYSATVGLFKKAANSKLLKWGTFGATAVLAGLMSGSKEAARLKRERAQHIRESAKGMEFKEEDMKRRKEMEENRYETKNASEIIKNLEQDLAKVSTGNVKEADLDAVLANLSDIEARIKLGDEKKIDLVSYSKFNEVEKERMNLDLYRAKLKVAIRKGIEEGRIEFTKGGNFDDHLKRLTTVQSTVPEGISKDIEEKDKIFKSMKRKKVAAAFARTVLIGGAAGFAFQELHSIMSDAPGGVIGGTIKHFRGDTDHMPTKATALEGLRRWIMHESPSVPYGHVHETILGNTHFQLPEGTEIIKNPDGTVNIFHGIDEVSKNVKIGFNANGDLDDASKALLAKDNVFANFFQTGGKVTEHVTRTGEEYINKHPELTTKIHRGWMGNDTPMHGRDPQTGKWILERDPVTGKMGSGADLNELRTQWGGVGGSGIDSNGNYVFDTQHMTNDGSFQDGLSVAAQDEMKKGKLTLLLSVTKGTEHTVFKVPIDATGKAIIDPKSVVGQMMFKTDGGHAVFTGQFAEIGHSTGLAEDGGENMQILGTYEGTGHPGDIIEEITKNTIHPNILLNVPNEWDYEVPPVLPFVPRRPLEKGEYGKGETIAPTTPLEPIPYFPYSPYYGAELNKKNWINELSPRLKKNPEAKLNPKEEINWYFEDQKRRYPGYIENDLSKLEAQNPEPLGKKVEAVVCVAVAGHQEFNNIYQTLDTYRIQKDKKGESVWKGDDSKFEVFLYVNWPQGKDPQKTFDEIERFKKDHPEVKVRVYKEEITTGIVELGWYKKKIFDLALKKHADKKTEDDIIIITNDADMTFTSTNYLENAVSSLNSPENQKNDAVLGRGDLDPETYKNNPTFHAAMKFWQFMEAVMRSKYGLIGTQGRNTIMRGSSYAAVGGNGVREYWADLEFGQKFDMARGKSSVAYSNDAWVTVDPRREIDKFKSGEKIAWTWSGDFDSRDVRGTRKSENSIPENLNVAELAGLEENDAKVVEFKKRLQEELQEIVRLFSEITPGAISYPNESAERKEIHADIKMLAERAAGFIGVKINMTKGTDGAVNVEITDTSKLRSNLKKYNETDGDKVKMSPEMKKLREDARNAEMSGNPEEIKKIEDEIKVLEIQEKEENKTTESSNDSSSDTTIESTTTEEKKVDAEKVPAEPKVSKEKIKKTTDIKKLRENLIIAEKEAQRTGDDTTVLEIEKQIRELEKKEVPVKKEIKKTKVKKNENKSGKSMKQLRNELKKAEKEAQRTGEDKEVVRIEKEIRNLERA